ncbi:MAG: RNA polymerase sigma-70 factor [Prevotellaceae bacterium]|jgi:RNA polymerase sigma-70 factor (ECF subfamily)|nr:RNA polymerase sigma-70 factor [Prevotellaceae bacterium]
MNDYQYVEKLAQDDHESFRRLFMRYFPKLKVFIAGFVKSEAIAEELSQDVFVKIWEKRKTLTAIQSFNAYIYRMAKNVVLNYFQHEHIEKRYIGQLSPDNAISADELFQAKETELLIQLTVAKMPAQRKKIFELSRKSQLKNEEIAQKLHLSKKTVENHLNLALREIRELLKNFFTIF